MPLLANFGEAVLASVAAALGTLLSFIPGLIGAVLLLVIGWIVSDVVARVVTTLLRRIGFETAAERVGATHFIAMTGARSGSASAAFGEIVKWFIRLLFVEMAAQALRITVVSGLVATLAGGMLGDWFRKRNSGSYFIVSGVAMLLAFPLLLAVLHAPFPLAWVLIFLTIFCLFFNTGPTNTILANVTHPSIRATGFAMNIFVIHLLGDAASPWLIGEIADRTSMNLAFTLVSFTILIGGIIWLWAAKYLGEDTERAPDQLAIQPG